MNRFFIFYFVGLLLLMGGPIIAIPAVLLPAQHFYILVCSFIVSRKAENILSFHLDYCERGLNIRSHFVRKLYFAFFRP